MALFDDTANFMSGVLKNSPGTAGTSFELQTGEGGNFTATLPYDCVLFPAAPTVPTLANAELARVEAKAGDKLTIKRAQYGSTAKNVVAGYQIFAGGPTARMIKLIQERLEKAVTAVNVMALGAKGEGAASTTADTAAINAALATGEDVFFPEPPSFYSFKGTMKPVAMSRLMGQGGQQRWRSKGKATSIRQAESGVPLLEITNPAEGAMESVEVWNLQLDGTGTTGAGSHGLYINGLPGTEITTEKGYTEGLFFFDAGFVNFSGFQVKIDGLVIDVGFDHCLIRDRLGTGESQGGVSAVESGGSGKVITQLSFSHCLMAMASAGKWAYDGTASDVTFVRGTLSNGVSGANGIRQIGGLTVYGLHMEEGNIALVWAGTQGAFISPAYMAAFKEGVIIGNPASPTTFAQGAVLSGMLAGANTNFDVKILAGGSRAGTVILGSGRAGGALNVNNERATKDGVNEVTRLDIAPAEFPVAEGSGTVVKAGRTFPGTYGAETSRALNKEFECSALETTEVTVSVSVGKTTASTIEIFVAPGATPVPIFKQEVVAKTSGEQFVFTFKVKPGQKWMVRTTGNTGSMTSTYLPV
jgi:hypothetical protein